MNKKVVSIILGLMCLILTYGIAVQIKTVNNTNSKISTNAAENELRSQVLKFKEKYDNRYNELEKAENELEKERENITKKDTAFTDMEEKIKQGNKILGLNEVSGSGVIIVLQDGSTKSAMAQLDPSKILVHDLDILSVVNELKNAGAEAISVNDQRIVPISSITCDGNVVKINDQKVGTPFEIKAIGLPEQLAALSRPGGYLSKLEEDGVQAELKKSENITIPKYSGVIDFEYAQNK